MSTTVYIDGLNLYHRAVKGTPYKWLDLDALCKTLLPRAKINRLRYFTARVAALPHDMQAPDRQDIYFRALRTISNLTIHMGHFAYRPTLLPKFPLEYQNYTKPPKMVKVLRPVEKGSDVNLSTFLLVDCFINDFDEAVVISNDSDLALPIQMVTAKFGKTVGVINPNSNRREIGKVNKDLERAASSYMRMINIKVIANCQFPGELTDSQGKFSKPATW